MFRLAKELGIYDVDSMLDGTDPRLLLEWQAYYELEPFGEVRADIRSAIVAQTVASAMGAKKQGGGKFTLKDFMPEFDKPAPRNEYTPAEALPRLRQLYGNNRKLGR